MKSIIIATTALLSISTQALAVPRIFTNEVILEERVCQVVPSRDAGYIKAGGETIRLTTPERQDCSYVPTIRVRSRTWHDD